MSSDLAARSALAFARPRDRVREVGPGAVASFLLHLSAVLILVFAFLRAADRTEVPLRVVPIDVVIRLGDQTTSPPALAKSPTPLARAVRVQKKEESNPRPYEGTAPAKTRPVPLDDLDAKLRALSRMRMAAQPLPSLDNAGTADEAASSGTAPGPAMYALRDFVRATAERHWNLDFAKLGRHKFAIALHIVMKRNGTIQKADIVDRSRYANDAVFRTVALSARNAVLLSSPIPLPPGDYEDETDLTLIFDPNDMRR